MSKPVSYAQVAQVLSSQGIPYNPLSVQAMCDQHGAAGGMSSTHMGSLQKLCGCGGKPSLDRYGKVKYDCGCTTDKPSL